MHRHTITLQKRVIKAMKCFILPCLAIMTLVSSCTKKKSAAVISGTINGIPTMTLYGDSRKPADYILLSIDPTQNKMAYSGHIFTYIYFSGSTTKIFVRDSLVAIGQGYLTVTGPTTSFRIDTTFGYTFGSKVYESD
jgi:hypothetical protein